LYNFSILYNKRLIFLFYTNTFVKHQHHIIYSTNLFNKIFIFLQFLIISFNLLSLSLSLSLSLFSFNPYLLTLFLYTETQFVAQPQPPPHHPRHFHKCKSNKDHHATTHEQPKKIHINYRPRKSKHPKFYRKLHTHKPRKSYQPRKFIPINIPIPTTMK